MRADKIITEEQFNEILERPNLDRLVEVLADLPSFQPRDLRRQRQGPFSLPDIGTGLLDRMRRFERSFDTICQVDGAGCLVWGLMKLLIVNVSLLLLRIRLGGFPIY